jgi:hypothetical protein
MTMYAKNEQGMMGCGSCWEFYLEFKLQSSILPGRLPTSTGNKQRKTLKNKMHDEQ